MCFTLITFFHRLFTIRGLNNGHCVPLAFSLLVNKQTYGIRGCKTCYECFFKVIYADFETAIHNVVTTVWPDCEVKACRFHLVQRSWRKIQSLWPSKQYRRKDSEVSQFLKIFGLSLLPPVEVSDCFALEFIYNLQNDRGVEQFCD